MHDVDDCLSRRASNGLNGPTGISTVGAHFPHPGQSPYGAALLSHTEKQHQDRCLEKSSLSNLCKEIISVPAEETGFIFVCLFNCDFLLLHLNADRHHDILMFAQHISTNNS